MRTHLLVAAEPVEFHGLAKRIGPWEPLPWPLDFARRTVHRGNRWVTVANGAGPALARRAVAVAAERSPVDTVVSTGFCGGLDEALVPAAIFVARRVVCPDSAADFDACLPRTSRDYVCGSIISIDRFVATAAEKRLMNERGVDAVEMEAAGAASEAALRGLPFFCIRAVTDAAGDSFRFDFNSVRDRSGRFSRWRLFGQVLRRPLASVPELTLLLRRSGAASETLGEFLADCEF